MKLILEKGLLSVCSLKKGTRTFNFRLNEPFHDILGPVSHPWEKNIQKTFLSYISCLGVKIKKSNRIIVNIVIFPQRNLGSDSTSCLFKVCSSLVTIHKKFQVFNLNKTSCRLKEHIVRYTVLCEFLSLCPLPLSKLGFFGRTVISFHRF